VNKLKKVVGLVFLSIEHVCIFGRDFEICNYRLRGLAYLHIDGIRRAYIFACLLS
jgi:hypothetical protein